ncbi:hypothetical protein A2U01_0099074, partial [Trifolium medium]|nr:hypothetical protein [Trifolium medium]
KQVVTVSESEPDVKDNVPDIVTSEKKRIGGKGVPENVPPAPMDNISFHSDEGA